jgi:hypothetical protein
MKPDHIDGQVQRQDPLRSVNTDNTPEPPIGPADGRFWCAGLATLGLCLGTFHIRAVRRGTVRLNRVCKTL